MGTVPASRAAIWQKISIILTLLPTFPSTVKDSIQNSNHQNLHWLIHRPKSTVAESCHSRIMSHYRGTTQPQRMQYKWEKVYYSFACYSFAKSCSTIAPWLPSEIILLGWWFAFVFWSFPPQQNPHRTKMPSTLIPVNLDSEDTAVVVADSITLRKMFFPSPILGSMGGLYFFGPLQVCGDDTVRCQFQG